MTTRARTEGSEVQILTPRPPLAFVCATFVQRGTSKDAFRRPFRCVGATDDRLPSRENPTKRGLP